MTSGFCATQKTLACISSTYGASSFIRNTTICFKKTPIYPNSKKTPVQKKITIDIKLKNVFQTVLEDNKTIATHIDLKIIPKYIFSGFQKHPFFFHLVVSRQSSSSIFRNYNQKNSRINENADYRISPKL